MHWDHHSSAKAIDSDMESLEHTSREDIRNGGVECNRTLQCDIAGTLTPLAGDH